MNKSVGQIALFPGKGFERGVAKEGMELSGGNINHKGVSRTVRTKASNRRETGGRKFVVDSLIDWKPVEHMQKGVKPADVLVTRRLLGLCQ